MDRDKVNSDLLKITPSPDLCDKQTQKQTFPICDLKLSYYAKYLDIDDKCSIKYKLNPNDVIAFRISKTDLRIRPIYHTLVSFVSYAIFKEFDRRLKQKDIKFNFSQKLLRKIIEHFTALKIDDELLPINPSPIQKQILQIFEN